MPVVVGELVAPAVVVAAVVDPAEVVGEPVVGLAVPVVVGELVAPAVVVAAVVDLLRWSANLSWGSLCQLWLVNLWRQL